MATHSSVLAWRIPWTEEPGGLQSMERQRVRHDGATNTVTFITPETAEMQLFLDVEHVCACVCTCVRSPRLQAPSPQNLEFIVGTAGSPSALCFLAAGTGGWGPGVVGSRGSPRAGRSPDNLPGPAMPTSALSLSPRSSRAWSLGG